ncbi:hypothetical protein JOB18_031775 [Solea senegalensis]|uniref:Uncharacterized protein n=1 Tax=Solea senegalensis TaxID=28829 RepID=A0AAV6QKN1_SOLSE|nr:hypothetical protein JOB18_031775 [Solea senegalensis]
MSVLYCVVIVFKNPNVLSRYAAFREAYLFNLYLLFLVGQLKGRNPNSHVVKGEALQSAANVPAALPCL